MVDKKFNRIYNLPVLHDDLKKGIVSVDLKKILAVSNVFDLKFIVLLESGGHIECKIDIYAKNGDNNLADPNTILYQLEQERSRLFQAWAEMVNA